LIDVSQVRVPGSDLLDQVVLHVFQLLDQVVLHVFQVRKSVAKFWLRMAGCQDYTGTAQGHEAQATKGKVSDEEERLIVREGRKRTRLSFIFLLPNPCIIIGCS
jgi:hypothetical protein